MNQRSIQNQTPGTSHEETTGSSNVNVGLQNPAHLPSMHISTGQTLFTAAESSSEPMVIDDDDVIMGESEEESPVDPEDLLFLPPGPIRRPKDLAREAYISQHRASPKDSKAWVELRSRPYYTSTPPDRYEHRCRKCLHAPEGEEEDPWSCRKCRRVYWKRRYYDYDLGKLMNAGKLMICRWDDPLIIDQWLG
ncbi:hypothetical protein ABW21_db0202309 [Orbilia brochopaga]|nr:hypothetical protein ABW21_db0202309 [Drechslerella brochopaga]